MKKFIILIAALFLMLASSCWAADAIYNRDRPSEIVGWSVFGADDDIDAAAELITELDTTYAQLAAADTIEILSAEAADTTQTVTVTGIDSNGKKASEEFALTGTTVVAGTTTFSYIDQVSVDTECAGAITIRRATGDTLIISIPIGVLEGTVVQHFNGEYNSYITFWRASVTSTTGSVIFQLRWYSDDADCLDSGDGFYVLDEIVLTNALDTDSHDFPQPIKCPAGGWIAIFATGGAANSDGSVTLQGYDSIN